MKPISDLFPAPKKFKKIRKAPQSSLFAPDFKLLKTEHCPKCTAKLYWNRTRTILICKKKSCNFVLPKKSYEEIVKGKRLEEWKKQDALNRR